MKFLLDAQLPPRLTRALTRGGALHGYRAGTDGPKAADELLARDGRRWRSLGPTPAPAPD